MRFSKAVNENWCWTLERKTCTFMINLGDGDKKENNFCSFKVHCQNKKHW